VKSSKSFYIVRTTVANNALGICQDTDATMRYTTFAAAELHAMEIQWEQKGRLGPDGSVSVWESSEMRPRLKGRQKLITLFPA
jgi:hypothetical protein